MTVVVVDDAAALCGLRPEWEALWSACPGATPFQHPGWLLPWWGAFGTVEPRVAVWRKGGALAGVLPCYVLRGAGGPKLLPIGAGTSDYLDVLGTGVAPLLAGVLGRAGSDGVGRCDFIEMPPASPLREVPAPPGWTAYLGPGSACPVLDLASELPRTIARKLRMSRHRADREGGWRMEGAGPEALEVLIRLHGARWARVGGPGVLADTAVLTCLRTALPALEAAGLLRFRLLRIGGEIAATILGFVSPGRLFFYLHGYDPARAFVSPGTLLIGAMVEEAAAEGRREAHFLRGREAYKYAWGAVDRANANRSFALSITGAG